MATLSEQERKRIQRYCICPKVAGTALAMAFVLPFLIIPFEMIDDIVFHHEGFQETGMIAALVLTAVVTCRTTREYTLLKEVANCN